VPKTSQATASTTSGSFFTQTKLEMKVTVMLKLKMRNSMLVWQSLKSDNTRLTDK